MSDRVTHHTSGAADVNKPGSEGATPGSSGGEGFAADPPPPPMAPSDQDEDSDASQ